MRRAEWRSPAAYEDLRSPDAPGFAWEFLNRNHAFKRDCKRLEHANDQDPFSADELEDFARCLGGSISSYARVLVAPLVDTGELAERDPDNPALTRSLRPEFRT
jgi:hypothetical protein